MKPLMVGQAPARSGDGRPFTGPSGERLQKLLALRTYDQLCEVLDMTNLLSEMQAKHGAKGDEFNLKAAEVRAVELMIEQQRLGRQDVICAGRQVWKAFSFDSKVEFLTRVKVDGISYHLFPHPSGISHFWNSYGNTQRASAALRAIVYGA